MNKYFFAIGVLSLFCVAAPSASHALSCMAPDYKKTVEQGGVVFVGRAVSVTEAGVVRNEYGTDEVVLQVQFSLERAWSTNAVSKNITLVQRVSASPGNDVWGLHRRFSVGQLYTVLASKENGELRGSAGACSGTETYADMSDSSYLEFLSRMQQVGIGSGYVPADVTTEPRESLTATPAFGIAPLTVSFTSRGIGQNTIDFGDGTNGSLQMRAVDIYPAEWAGTHTYTSPGTYIATLRYVPGPNEGNCAGTDCWVRGTARITVSGSTNNGVNFTAYPTSGSVPLSVSFSASGGSFTAIDFGDGSSESAPLYNACPKGVTNCNVWQPKHTYAVPGFYTAKLINGYQGGVPAVVKSLTVSVSGVSPQPTPPSTSCPVIRRQLARGSSGTDVRTLQNYFISIGVLGNSSATGYFGPLTEGAVQEWQASHALVSSGSPATTGWGVVGPRTRALLARCGQ